MKKVRMTLVILITVFFCNKIYAQTEVLSATLQQGDKIKRPLWSKCFY